MAYGQTPVSTTTLSTDQFPVSAVAVPEKPNGDLTALEGGGEITDGNSNTMAPAVVEDIERPGYVAASGTPPTQITANTDTPYAFASTANRLILQNNYSVTVYFDFDQAASTASFALLPGSFLSYPKKFTTAHFYAASIVPINSAGGLLVRGAL